MSTLLDLIQTKVNYVVQEAIVVIKDIFRKYPNKCVATAPAGQGSGVLGPRGRGEEHGEHSVFLTSLLLCAPGLNRNQGGKDKARILFLTSLSGSS